MKINSNHKVRTGQQCFLWSKSRLIYMHYF